MHSTFPPCIFSICLWFSHFFPYPHDHHHQCVALPCSRSSCTVVTHRRKEEQQQRVDYDQMEHAQQRAARCPAEAALPRTRVRLHDRTYYGDPEPRSCRPRSAGPACGIRKSCGVAMARTRVRSVDTSFRAWVDVFLFPRFVPPIVVDLHPRATGPQLLMISAEN